MSKAKFDRSKPHVNIGTIGHLIAILSFGAFLCASPLPAFASPGGWGQKISDKFHEMLGQTKKSLRPIRVQFLPLLQAKKIIFSKSGGSVLRKS